MRSGAFLFIFATSFLAACASTPGVDDDLGGSADDSTVRDGGKSPPSTKDAGTSKDAGKSSTPSGGSSSSGSSSSGSSSSSRDAGGAKASDAATPGLPDLSGILSGFAGGSSDASTPPAKPDGGLVDSCENLVCFDVFDCALWHTDKLDCGFTACTGFVCTK